MDHHLNNQMQTASQIPCRTNGGANGHSATLGLDPDSSAKNPGPNSWRVGFVGLGKLGMPVALALSLMKQLIELPALARSFTRGFLSPNKK